MSCVASGNKLSLERDANKPAFSFPMTLDVITFMGFLRCAMGYGLVFFSSIRLSVEVSVRRCSRQGRLGWSEAWRGS